MSESLNITNEDCMDLMSRYPDNHFDLAIVDPPYGIGAGGKSFINRNTKNIRAEKLYKDNDWDKVRPSKEYFTELRRVSKHQIIWGGNYFVDLLTPARCYIVWDKKTGANSYADCELALTSIDSNAKIFTKFWLGAHAQDKGDNRIHPTQKPVSLYQWLLINYAKEGDKILDTHIGSASIAIALDSVNKVEKMDLTLTACEIDKEYYDKAMKRIAEQTAWQSLL